MEGGAGTLRRHRLGRALRELRERAGLTGEEVAGRIERSGSWVSRVEAGRISIRVRDLEDLLEIYGVSDSHLRATLSDLAREGRQRGWWSHYSDSIPELMVAYIGLEDVASTIFMYDDQVVPGLLQLKTYMRGLFANNFPPLEPAVIEARMAVRIQRQQILQRPNRPSVEVILEESVLHRAYGGKVALKDQLESLLAKVRNGLVTCRVVPFANPTVLVHSFTIMGFPQDPDVLFTEVSSGMTFHDGDKIDEFWAVAEHLRAVALDAAGSVAAIERALGTR